MSLVAGCVCALLLVAAGWWPMRALGAGLIGTAWWERVALATALGAALTGLVQLAASAWGVPTGIGVPLVLAAASLALAGWRARSHAHRSHGAPGADATAAVLRPPLPRWLGALLVVTALVGTSAAVGRPFVADGSRIWGAKARDLSRVAAVDSRALGDPGREAVHRDYPLLAPALLAPAFGLSPPDAVAGPKFVLAVLEIALLALMASLLAREGPRGLLALAVFACVPFLASDEVRESALSGGYVDGVVALFLLLLVVALERARRAERPLASLAVAGLCGAALLSTKLEGGVELLVVAAAALLLWARRGGTLAAVGLALLLAVPTFLIRAGIGEEQPGFLLAWLTDPDVLRARSVPVAAGLIGLALDVSSFGLLPLLLIGWLAMPGPSARRDTGRLRSFALLLLLGMLGLMLVSYLSTTMHASRHMHTSAHRLLWHVLPAVTWLVVRAGGEGERAGA
ncbi:MAG: hypothetical protein ACYTG2_03790 [Planctomycetota bacterium]|jgi:hypothetical protein